MICGIFYKDPKQRVSEAFLRRMVESSAGGSKDSNFYVHRHVGFACRDRYAGESCLYKDNAKTVSVVFQGAVYNEPDLRKSVDGGNRPLNGAQMVALLYRKFGETFVEKLRGKFIFGIHDRGNNRLLLGRDRLGIEPFFYLEDGNSIVFGSSVFAILAHPDVDKRLDCQAVYQFLLYCYNPSFRTFFRDVQKLRPGHVLTHHNGSSTVRRYWKLSFANPGVRDEGEAKEKLLALLQEAVRIRVASRSGPGVFLSGGMDSSTVVSLVSPCSEQPIHTFSYRCQGESFDEAGYAQIVAERYRTRHTLVEYASGEVGSIAELVASMDEPFCDVGINIATGLLGRACRGKVSCVLTGDGGDELFGGHPVYLADRAGRLMDCLPGLIKNPFLWAGSKLGDSEQKKDFKVKWKRFSTSVRFPSALLSHRWRVYYTPDELADLLKKELVDEWKTEALYGPILAVNAEADGQDSLSRSLYSDYHTVVGFYLRRMDLIRRYGVESRFPLLDDRLVEFGASMPSGLKIRRGSDTKYILKQAMRGILPDEIVFRKDKLGHSIPLKNWMRNDSGVQSLMMDLLSRENIEKRGFFDARVVSGFVDDHLSWKRNNSHRLWALMVLELWLREHLDR